MTEIEIDYRYKIRRINIDLTSMLKDVFREADESQISLIIKRIKQGRFSSAVGLAWAAISENNESEYEFALRYGKEV